MDTIQVHVLQSLYKMGHPTYSEEVHWLLFYRMLGLSLPQIECLCNARFPDVPRNIDAIQTKLKEVKNANKLQGKGSDKISLPKIDLYLKERIDAFDITLRQHYYL